MDTVHSVFLAPHDVHSVSSTWLVLGNILHVCLLWFSGKYLLTCFLFAPSDVNQVQGGSSHERPVPPRRIGYVTCHCAAYPWQLEARAASGCSRPVALRTPVRGAVCCFFWLRGFPLNKSTAKKRRRLLPMESTGVCATVTPEPYRLPVLGRKFIGLSQQQPCCFLCG